MNQIGGTWRIIDLLKVSEKALLEKNITNPRLNAELLLADTLKTTRINLYLDFERPLDEKEITAFREKLRRRMHHEPLQYITGYTEFYGLNFKVNQSVLIPRPETELLVDKSLELLASGNLLSPYILEIGTGSGCISIAIASKLNCRIDAIDGSEKALDVAGENSRANGTDSRINNVKADIFTDFVSFDNYDLVVSNPPYVPVYEFNNLEKEIRDYEPRFALTDEKDGLEFYRRIIELAKKTKTGTAILLEVGDGKKEKVEELLILNKIDKYVFHKDYQKTERVLQIEVN